MNDTLNNIEISVVIPAYKCENCIEELYNRLISVKESIGCSFEIIFVNDGSPENDWEVIKKLSEKDEQVKGINFSRNFGQHTAITAGLDAAVGEWTVVMDCDLQDLPEEIGKLYKKALEGYDVVFAKRVDRKDNILKKISSKIFYKVLSYLTNTYQDETIGNFGIYNKKAIDAVKRLRESLRYFPVMIRWIGFKTSSVAVIHNAGTKRKSSYNLNKLLSLALSIMLATSDKPLKLVVKLGLLISTSSFAIASYLIVKAIRGDFEVLGWPSLIVSIWLMSGVIISILGILGLYIGSVFTEVKNKPLYIIDEVISKKGKI